MPLTLYLHPQDLAICTLPPDAVPPHPRSNFYSVTRTPDELSLVLPTSDIPTGATADSDWRARSVSGPLPFDTVGVIAGLTVPLANAGISIFSPSTYRTDYLLLRREDIGEACKALTDASYSVLQC